jgi:hypothetical protein
MKRASHPGSAGLQGGRHEAVTRPRPHHYKSFTVRSLKKWYSASSQPGAGVGEV